MEEKNPYKYGTVEYFQWEAEREMKYRNSEAGKREQHERQEDRWEKAARKRGWHYTRKPYVSALDRQQAAEHEKQEEIARLKERLAELEGTNK